MGIIIRQSIRNALLSYIGIAIGFITTIKLFPSILDTEQFGLTRTMLAIMFIGAHLIGVGLPSSIVKFFPTLYKESDNKKGLFLPFFINIVFTFTLFSFVFILFKEPILNLYSESPLVREYYLYILPLIFFSAAFNLLKSYTTALLDTVFASFLQEVLLRIVVIADLILYFLGLISFKVFMIIFVLNFGLQFFAFVLYALKNKYMDLSFSTDFINRKMIRSIGTFSLYSFLGGLTMMIVGNIDMLMLSTLSGLTDTAIYSVAFYVGTVISIPRRTISKISLPLIVQYFENKEMDKVSKIYKQSSLNQFLFGFLLYVGVWANIHNLYAILPPEYATGSLVILIIGAANLFDMITGANSEIIMSSSYYKFGLYFSIFLVVLTVSLNFILIPIYGITGAALSTAAALLVYNIAKLIFVWIKLSIQPFQLKLIPLLVTGVAALGISLQLEPFSNLYIDLFLRSLFITVLYCSIIWLFNLSDEFNEAVRNIYSRILKYF